jgi:DNA-binding NarL/FixJ family response regulator
MKILVVDDHVLIRESLRGVLRELKSDAVILEASDSRQAMQFIAEHADIRLILLDLGLPDRDGFSMLAELGERCPATSVVVLSAQHDRGSVVKALDLGALGFIPKSAQREVMLAALDLVFSGGIYIPPEILSRQAAVPSQSAPQPSATDSARGSPRDFGLTGRQLEVLAHMVRGKSNKGISRALDMAEPTVKNHVTAVITVIKSGWELPSAP